MKKLESTSISLNLILVALKQHYSTTKTINFTSFILIILPYSKLFLFCSCFMFCFLLLGGLFSVVCPLALVLSCSVAACVAASSKWSARLLWLYCLSLSASRSVASSSRPAVFWPRRLAAPPFFPALKSSSLSAGCLYAVASFNVSDTPSQAS